MLWQYCTSRGRDGEREEREGDREKERERKRTRGERGWGEKDIQHIEKERDKVRNEEPGGKIQKRRRRRRRFSLRGFSRFS